MAIQYAPLFALETQFQTKDGRNNTGGWLKVFLAATDDPATTYSDYNGTRNPEKIVLDDDGRALVICDKSKAYRLEVYDINGTLLWTEEPVYCSGTGGGGVSITKVISTDGSISVDENVAGSTTTYDLSLGINTDDLKPSCLKASSNPLTADGQFVFAETAHEGTLLSVDKVGKVRMEPAWYHFTAIVELAYDVNPVNKGRRVTLWTTGSSSVVDFDTSYSHRESIELSGDIHVDAANTEFLLGVTGIGDGISASLVGFDIHAVTGNGGSNEYRAGDGITIVNATRTISADFGSVQEKLVAGDNISISGNVISAVNISQEQADWTESDTSSPAYIKHKPDLGVYATRTELNSGLATKQDTISDLSQIRAGAASGATAVQPGNLSAVATTGDYNDLDNRPDLGVYATRAEVNTGLAGKQDTISDLAAIRSGAQLGATSVQPADLGSYATDAELADGLSTKQDVINDLSEIRSGAAAGSTALQPSDVASVATTGNYDDLSNKPSIPTRTSDLTNDSGFITSADVQVKGVEVDGASVVNAQGVAEITMPDLSGYATTQALDTGLAGKQDVISDLSTIRSGAAAGATSVQPGDLATVATTGSYDDLSGKPDLSVYATGAELTAGLATKQDTISDLAAIRSGAESGATAVQPSDLAAVATSGSYEDLSDKPAIPAAQVQSDWSEYDTASKAYIRNKPNLNVYAFRTELKNGLAGKQDVISDLDQIRSGAAEGATAVQPGDLATVATTGNYDDLTGKPDLSIYAESSNLATVATTGSYDDLADKPTIPAAQVNSDWNASSGVAEILNKPTLSTVATTGDYDDLVNKPSIPAAQINSDWTETDTSSKAYIRNKPDLGVYATRTELTDGLAGKQDTVTDLDTIRSGAALGSTAVQPGDLPSVDQSYSSSSTNAQSGTAVAQAISGVDAVPEVTSSDSGKVLVAAYSGGTGSYAWASNPPANAVILDSSSTWSDFHTPYSAGRKDIYYKHTNPYAPFDPRAELYLHLTAVCDVDGSSTNYTFALFEGAWNLGGVDYSVRCKFRYSGRPLVHYTSWEVDQSYSSSSKDAQSGVAVAQAISAVNQVPASTSADEGKVLTVGSNGDPEWGTGLTQVQSDWAQSDSTAVDYIKNKPNLATVATTGAYSDLTGTPTIPAAQVNADWNSSSGASEILNKPTIPSGTQLVPAATSADADKVLTVDAQGTPAWASAQAPISAGNGIDITNNVVSVDTSVVATQTDLAGKQDTISDLAMIRSGAAAGATALQPSALDDYSTTAQVNAALATKQDELTAGANVQISNNVVSATDTTYSAGTGIDITNDVISVETPVDIVAGPGIVIDNPDGNTLRVSVAHLGDWEDVTSEITKSTTIITGGSITFRYNKAMKMISLIGEIHVQGEGDVYTLPEKYRPQTNFTCSNPGATSYIDYTPSNGKFVARSGANGYFSWTMTMPCLGE